MKFGIAGTGNVAWHLAEMFTGAGHELLKVYGRNHQSAGNLAIRHSAEVAESAAELKGCDLVFVSVNDDSIGEVAHSIPSDVFVIHTSGSASIDVMPQHSRGVMWPVQSLTRGEGATYQGMPVVIEASGAEERKLLRNFIEPARVRIYELSGDKRRELHMAAVFASNFPNHMYAIASRLAARAGADFQIMKPLIFGSVEKLRWMDPLQAQTGPAMRGDEKTMERHLEMLNNDPDLREMYRLISESIANTHGK
ncbi:MAG: hypothetical protein RL220_1925 [Bacteroidota bacterium]